MKSTLVTRYRDGSNNRRHTRFVIFLKPAVWSWLFFLAARAIG